MGLLSRFTRRFPITVATRGIPAGGGWHPVVMDTQECDQRDMAYWITNWEGCPGDITFMIQFARDDAPGWLTIWVYPAQGPGEGTYVLRFAYEYQVEYLRGAPWRYTGYEDDPDQSWESMSLRTAEESARDVALGVLVRGPESGLECFGWNGAAF